MNDWKEAILLSCAESTLSHWSYAKSPGVFTPIYLYGLPGLRQVLTSSSNCPVPRLTGVGVSWRFWPFSDSSTHLHSSPSLFWLMFILFSHYVIHLLIKATNYVYSPPVSAILVKRFNHWVTWRSNTAKKIWHYPSAGISVYLMCLKIALFVHVLAEKNSKSHQSLASLASDICFERILSHHRSDGFRPRKHFATPCVSYVVSKSKVRKCNGLDLARKLRPFPKAISFL